MLKNYSDNLLKKMKWPKFMLKNFNLKCIEQRPIGQTLLTKCSRGNKSWHVSSSAYVDIALVSLHSPKPNFCLFIFGQKLLVFLE